MPDLFSPDGIAAWLAHLNTSRRFADAAGSWEGALLLVEGDPGQPGRTTWVRIAEGRCREVRPGRASDTESAEFILAAPADTWRDLVSAATTPVAAALAGRLRLIKGNLLKLVPHAKAAAELLAAAGES